MAPRIETAEVLSFRLQVPAGELLRLPVVAAPELTLVIEDDEGETVVSVSDSDSYLRFRPVGDEAMLTEIFVCNVVGGLFFERVLAPLMVRFGGDLHALLVWGAADRGRQGEFSEVRIVKGRTPEPAASAAAPPGSPLAGLADEGDSAEEDGPEAPAPLELEVQESLARARAHWAEYQRLKAKKG